MEDGIVAEVLGGTFVPIAQGGDSGHLGQRLWSPWNFQETLGWKLCLALRVTVGFSAMSIYTPTPLVGACVEQFICVHHSCSILFSLLLLPELHLGRSPSLHLRSEIPLGIL